jgi:hypothetical protein
MLVGSLGDLLVDAFEQHGKKPKARVTRGVPEDDL